MAKASVAKRIGWTVLHLGKQPRWALPYVRDNLIQGGAAPLDLRLPWFSYGAIDWLKKNLNPSLRIIEFGSGGSSLFFADHCATVVAYEHDLMWAEKLRSASGACTNLDIRLVEVEAFADPSRLPSQTLEDADLIVIDSYENEMYSLRPKLLSWVESVKPSSTRVIVLDDSRRYVAALNAASAKEVLQFGGLGPGRRGDTSTAILLY